MFSLMKAGSSAFMETLGREMVFASVAIFKHLVHESHFENLRVGKSWKVTNTGK